MKHSMLCSSFAHLVEGYHDGELEVEHQIAVANHVRGCASCSALLQELQELRRVMHASLVQEVHDLPERALDRVTHAVVSQARVERSDAWPARLGRMFDDLHLVWAGLAGSAATASCVAVVAAVLHFVPPERADSLAVLLSAPGTNRNPVRMDDRTALPRVDEQNVMRAMLVSESDMADQSMIVSGIVTREGRLSRAALLEAGGYARSDTRRLMDAVSAATFQPAQRGGSPVAVNLVWLLERTTVRGKVSS